MFRKFIPKSLINFYHLLWAFLGSVIFFFPSRKLVVIGVTGTNGKSTTVWMLCEILKQAGFKVAQSSSIIFEIAGESQPNLMKQTMPGHLFLPRFLRKAVRAGCRFAVIEVTSEGIVQNRHRFINWDGAVLINLAPEHLESHGSYEAYKKAKIRFFESVAVSPPKYLWGKTFEKFLAVHKEVKEADEFLNFPGVEKIIWARDDFVGLNLKLVGDFFTVNASGALAVAKFLEIESRIGLEAVNNLEVIPGRMEEIKNPHGFRVFVDYAHTPNSLETVYETFKKENPSRLICVLGSAGGGRDRWKRPEFGRIASQYCSQIILTNEDPYEEPPEAIIEEILKGVSPDSKVERIIDRKEAILRALKHAQTGDIVIITGKGCEPWLMAAGRKKIPWDDREVVRKVLEMI